LNSREGTAHPAICPTVLFLPCSLPRLPHHRLQTSKVRLQSQQIQQDSAVHVLAWTRETNHADHVQGFFQPFKCFWNGKTIRASCWSAPSRSTLETRSPNLGFCLKWHGLFDVFFIFWDWVFFW